MTEKDGNKNKKPNPLPSLSMDEEGAAQQSNFGQVKVQAFEPTQCEVPDSRWTRGPTGLQCGITGSWESQDPRVRHR